MAGYTIIAQRQTIAPSPAGGMMQVQEITFKTEHGAVGKVEIPLAEFTPENVAKMVGDRVDVIDAVYKLG